MKKKEFTGSLNKKTVEQFHRLMPTSAVLNEEARKWLPGGDSRSTIHYFPYPQYFARGEGCWLWDADNRKSLDLTGNHTSLILGYNHPNVVKALREQLELGACFPGPTKPQVDLARILCERVPSIERVRFCNSGTEATMNAIRAARAFTGRHKVAKAEGAFHGTHDIMSVSIRPDPDSPDTGPAKNPKPVPHVAGIPGHTFDDAVIIPYNDPEGSRAVIEAPENAANLACVIIEPVMGAAGMIPAEREYLQTLKEICAKHNILLIFDEVITFRLALGGAQEFYEITPDLACFGKMLGGGLPLGAFGGSEKIMSLFDPVKHRGRPPVHHGGSLNANPMSLVAGIATLEQLTEETFLQLEKMGDSIRASLQELLDKHSSVPARVTGAGSLFAFHFLREPGKVTNYRETLPHDRELQELRHLIFLGLLDEGVVMDPRGAGCLSTAFGSEYLELFRRAFGRVLERINQENN
ncbi:MAG: aspartate aminotransferase family protein [Candidatus Aminicenantes bacterium]|nr:aspartate aminotransferase family protein [Candidatus Aminicenantes bacterium]